MNQKGQNKMLTIHHLCNLNGILNFTSPRVEVKILTCWTQAASLSSEPTAATRSRASSLLNWSRSACSTLTRSASPARPATADAAADALRKLSTRSFTDSYQKHEGCWESIFLYGFLFLFCA